MLMKEGGKGSENWSKTKELIETHGIVGIGCDELTSGSELFHTTTHGDIILLRTNGKQFLLEAAGLPSPLEGRSLELDSQFSFLESCLPVKLLSVEDSFIDCRGHLATFSSINKPELIEWYNKTKSEIDMQDLHKSIKQNLQIVLTGSPGTGKTYLARELAATLLGCKVEELINNDQFGFVQFHPAYDYTDFVEGFKPIPGENGQIIFKLKNGIFKKFCNNAAMPDNTDKKFVFVIDEINRADLSRVFGELFYAIEPGYRGVKGAVETQYSSISESKFYVPENIYIIGTMNDIDRSVESIDFALRRRFAWHEIKADGARFDQVMQGVLKGNEHDNARERYTAINAVIGDTKGLGVAYCIGPAYFRKLRDYLDDENSKIRWEDFWTFHLSPLVREYLRGMVDEREIHQKLQRAFFLNVISEQ
jgi:hypothetical protein